MSLSDWLLSLIPLPFCVKHVIIDNRISTFIFACVYVICVCIFVFACVLACVHGCMWRPRAGIGCFPLSPLFAEGTISLN